MADTRHGHARLHPLQQRRRIRGERHSRTDANAAGEFTRSPPCGPRLDVALSVLALASCGVASMSAQDPQRIVVAATKATPPPVGTWDALCQHISDVSNLIETLTDSRQNQLHFPGRTTLKRQFVVSDREGSAARQSSLRG